MSAQTLGTRLKAERESRGFTLVQIASSTKIPATLLEALERGDLSRWPQGLYRRAFFRSYVTMLGLPPEPLLAEFTRLFPDDVSSPAPHDLQTAEREGAESGQPLTLSWAGPSTAHRMLRAGAVALVEVIAVAAAAGVVAWTTGSSPLESIGAVALVYLPVARLTAERSRRPHLRRGRATARPHQPSEADSEQQVADRPMRNLRASLVEGAAPVAARFAEARGIVSPVGRRAGQFATEAARATGRISGRGIDAASALLRRTHGAAGTGLAVAARETRRLSSRAFAAASHAFWRGVRAAAGYAELLASRQLNRLEE